MNNTKELPLFDRPVFNSTQQKAWYIIRKLQLLNKACRTSNKKLLESLNFEEITGIKFQNQADAMTKVCDLGRPATIVIGTLIAVIMFLLVIWTFTTAYYWNKKEPKREFCRRDYNNVPEQA